jgi:hypothetical protein
MTATETTALEAVLRRDRAVVVTALVEENLSGGAGCSAAVSFRSTLRMSARYD